MGRGKLAATSEPYPAGARQLQPGGGSLISDVVGDQDALQTDAREEAARGLEIGVPLAIWL